jgi:hypothetical protein
MAYIVSNSAGLISEKYTTKKMAVKRQKELDAKYPASGCESPTTVLPLSHFCDENGFDAEDVEYFQNLPLSK